MPSPVPREVLYAPTEFLPICSTPPLRHPPIPDPYLWRSVRLRAVRCVCFGSGRAIRSRAARNEPRALGQV